MNITAGIYKGQKITAPDENITRPTLSKVRMSVFNTLQSMIDFENSSFLDMYAGSGIMGLEALSRGFSKIVSIEKYKKDNYLKLILGDSLKICQKLPKDFVPDVIYIDPPYFSGIYESSLKSMKEIRTGIIILEHVTEVDFTGFQMLKQKKYGDKYITFLTAL